MLLIGSGVPSTVVFVEGLEERGEQRDLAGRSVLDDPLPLVHGTAGRGRREVALEKRGEGLRSGPSGAETLEHLPLPAGTGRAPRHARSDDAQMGIRVGRVDAVVD